MELQDRVLTCVDCGADFVFTVGEQIFFQDKQFKNLTQTMQGVQAETRSRPGSRPSL